MEVIMAPMASGDGSGPRPETSAPPHFPRLLAARAQLLRLDVPRRFAIDGKEVMQHEVVAVDVDCDSLLSPMGVGVALCVGDCVLVDSEVIEGNRVRFFAPVGKPWRRGAPVALGLAGSGPPRVLS